MTQLMNELHQDHQQISILLTILKNKLATLEGGARPNFALMSEVVDYLSDYAGSSHHEREDLLYRYLVEHYPANADIVSQQLQEHQELARLTLDMGRATHAAMLDAPVSLVDFGRLLKRFVDKQQLHLSLEESKVFPVVQRCFSRNDWQLVAAQLASLNGGQAKSTQQQRYRELTHALIEDLT